MNKRFKIEYCETNGILNQYTVIVDKKTGINYLLAKSGYGAGLTPLLDENGKPLITSKEG